MAGAFEDVSAVLALRGIAASYFEASDVAALSLHGRVAERALQPLVEPFADLGIYDFDRRIDALVLGAAAELSE